VREPRPDLPSKTCIGCGTLISYMYSRCDACEADQAGKYDRGWRRTSRQAIAAHLAERGPTCPGWGRPRHVVDPADLTGDHDEDDAVVVMCRSCNSAKRDRARPGRRRYPPIGIRVI
jgi:hypothetical protein